MKLKPTGQSTIHFLMIAALLRHGLSAPEYKMTGIVFMTASSALDDARKHRLEPAFDRFRKGNAIETRIVTALPQKADRIRRALLDHPNPSGIPIQISILPELINLIAPVPRTASV